MKETNLIESIISMNEYDDKSTPKDMSQITIERYLFIKNE